MAARIPGLRDSRQEADEPNRSTRHLAHSCRRFAFRWRYGACAGQRRRPRRDDMPLAEDHRPGDADRPVPSLFVLNARGATARRRQADADRRRRPTRSCSPTGRCAPPGTSMTAQFVDAVATRARTSFAIDPPNATVSMLGGGGSTSADAVVTISDAGARGRQPDLRCGRARRRARRRDRPGGALHRPWRPAASAAAAASTAAAADVRRRAARQRTSSTTPAARTRRRATTGPSAPALSRRLVRRRRRRPCVGRRRGRRGRGRAAPRTATPTPYPPCGYPPYPPCY